MNTLDRTIREIRSVWGDGEDPRLPLQVRDLMADFLTSVDRDEPWLAALLAEGPRARELHRDADYGFILKGHVHPEGHRRAPHDHGPCWVVYGTYDGQVEITTYRRDDPGVAPEDAQLAVEGVYDMIPGVCVPFLKGDIHSVHARERSVVFRFLSGDIPAPNK